jgi:phosphopantothenoylcysteine decarboxylase/phosphopantothenate--cysteine ligase
MDPATPPSSAPKATTATESGRARRVRAFVTAGPTEEPLDEVRFIGNRSSGRMGFAIATALADAGHAVTLALGPVRREPPDDPRISLRRFRTSAELESLMREELPGADLVVMAAAVADFRPKATIEGKLRRSDGGLQIELVPVPDLLSATAACRKPGAAIIGFALEPRERLERSALDKLARKDLAAIVANPLETMDAPDVDAVVHFRDGTHARPAGTLAKEAFARWLVAALAGRFG